MNAETVQAIAKLARLELSEDEIQNYATKMSQILESVEQLSGLDTEGIDATAHATALGCPLRQDSVVVSEVVQAIFKIAPDAEEQFFAVPKVL